MEIITAFPPSCYGPLHEQLSVVLPNPFLDLFILNHVLMDDDCISAAANSIQRSRRTFARQREDV